MKTYIAAFILSIFSISAQAWPLLIAERMPGFEMNPYRKSLILDSSGQLVLRVQSFRTNISTEKIVGQLSSAQVSHILNNMIETLDPQLPLVDDKEGQPQCTDAPSFTVTIFYSNGQNKMINRRAGCHEWSVRSQQAASLTDFALYYLNL
jgi:hypothetical protein